MILLFITGCGTENNMRVLHISNSPSSRFYVKVQFEDPGSAFGPHKVEVLIAQDKGIEEKLLEYYLKNDGANLSPENAKITWQSDSAFTVISKGEEQETETFEARYSEGKWTVRK